MATFLLNRNQEAMQYVAYYRVSTSQQGQSGLGLAAQRTTVLAYVKEAPLLAEYTEIESGKKNRRPQLLGAIAYAKKEGAMLIIAKLDRLSRNVAFIATLMETGVNFVACDLPEATPFTLHIMAALAEQERKLISGRTKAALGVLKTKGVKLGRPENLTEYVRRQGLEVRQRNAAENDHNRKATALILARRGQGTSFSQIARELNAAGFQASRGGTFNQKQVQRLYERANGIPRPPAEQHYG
ncbi:MULTISPECIES: recombinase family protein [Hymenobacter]|uniref:Site-specific DNA recombinase n=1 Tax=Hymenobacter mucosus TaxID=1411120 RepID=A0A239BIY4_9BACT|nr:MULTISPECIES: recombinase family protein [Hymenobacter]MDF7815932.1 recombinase family protein [Hymenobacter sp. YC55]SNS07023.1 Site-specific DNA recombinase [Hymenobacter mucosus]